MTGQMTDLTIQQRLAQVYEQITAACAAAGRSPDRITLVAVSKTHPPETVLEAVAAGHLDFGENRPEDAVDKMTAVNNCLALDAPQPRWHMIGHVQSRKARLVVGRYHLVHSVDSVKLAEKFSRLALDESVVQDILLEMNVSGEDAKSGWDAVGWQNKNTVRESLWSDIRSILALSGLCVRGLMTMAPIVDDPEETRPVFAALRRLRDALQEDFKDLDWSVLSMGMTDDYPVAIAEGATMLRIGRAIFGPRQVR